MANQLTLDDIVLLDDIEQAKLKFEQVVALQELPYKVIAVNKMYKDWCIIFDTKKSTMYSACLLKSGIKKDVPAPYLGEKFGPNYIVVDKRFKEYGSEENARD